MEYGQDFVVKLNYFTKIFVGIGDIKYPKFNIEDPVLYILFRIEDETFFTFFEFIREVRLKSYYVDDYTYKSDIRYGSYIVLAVKIPPKHVKTYHNFKKGLYSEMYLEDEISKLYSDKTATEIRVMKKDPTLKTHLQKRIIEEYGVEEFVDFENEIKEYELPPRLSDEVLHSVKNTLLIQKAINE